VSFLGRDQCSIVSLAARYLASGRRALGDPPNDLHGVKHVLLYVSDVLKLWFAILVPL
jgi:hypothetical protein